MTSKWTSIYIYDTIRSIQYTVAASGKAKIRSASWEKVDIHGLVTIEMYTHMVRYINIILEKILNEGFRMLSRI